MHPQRLSELSGCSRREWATGHCPVCETCVFRSIYTEHRLQSLPTWGALDQVCIKACMFAFASQQSYFQQESFEMRTRTDNVMHGRYPATPTHHGRTLSGPCSKKCARLVYLPAKMLTRSAKKNASPLGLSLEGRAACDRHGEGPASLDAHSHTDRSISALP